MNGANYSCDVFTMWYTQRNELRQTFIYTATISAILAIPTMIFNFVILMTVWKTPSLYSPSNIFLCNLAASDFALAFLGIPIAIAWMSSHYISLNFSVMCTLSYVSTISASAFGIVSFGTITAATVDRYLAVKLHLSYISIVTPQRVLFACGGIWIFSLAISFTIVSGISAYCWTTSPTILICTSIMAYCYYHIFLILRRHQHQIHCHIGGYKAGPSPNLLRFKKSIFILIYIFGLCVVLYTPYVSAMVVFQFVGSSLTILKFWLSTILLVYANSALNPIIYCWRIGEIRNAVKEKWNKLQHGS